MDDKCFNYITFLLKPYLSVEYIYFEDGIEDIVFIDNDLDYYATKAMFSCFKLIENQFNINFEVEEQKRATKKYYQIYY